MPTKLMVNMRSVKSVLDSIKTGLKFMYEILNKTRVGTKNRILAHCPEEMYIRYEINNFSEQSANITDGA